MKWLYRVSPLRLLAIATLILGLFAAVSPDSSGALSGLGLIIGILSALNFGS